MSHETTDRKPAVSVNRRAAAGVLLAVPFTLVLLTAYLNIAPLDGQMTRLFLSQGSINAIGTLVVLGSLGLVLGAFMLNAAAIFRGFTAGRGVTAYPLSLADRKSFV